MVIMHYAAIRVFLFPRKFIIYYLYNLIYLISNCWHLTVHQASMRLLVHIICSDTVNPKPNDL